MAVKKVALVLSVCFCFFKIEAHAGRATVGTDFAAWLNEHGKDYGSSRELQKRERIFYDNVEYINSLNHQYVSRGVKFALNQFADLTAEEFKSTILMPSRPAPVLPPDRYVASQPLGGNELPSSLDWRDKGVVTDVKDQGSVGSCWAFSTVGNLEGQWAMAGHNPVSLSAEQLVDCDSTVDPNNSSFHADCGIFGGWPYLAYQYVKQAGGIEPDSSYPYCSGFGKCFPCMAPGYNKTRCGPPVPYCEKNESCLAKLSEASFLPGLKVKSWVAIPKDENAVMSELATRGPLSIALNAMLLQFYHSGVWNPLLPCDPTALDHAILLVGYGTEKTLFGSKPYWLIKNSWGKKWGENGYFRLIRGKGECGVTQQVTSAVIE